MPWRKKGPPRLLHCSRGWLCSLPEELNTGLHSYVQSELTDPHHDETSPCFPKLGRRLFTLNQGRFWSNAIAEKQMRNTRYQRRRVNCVGIGCLCPDFIDSQQDELPT